jgi:rRNA maturation endonuclease Nob1
MSPEVRASAFQLIFEMNGVEGVIDYANHQQLPFAYCHGCGGLMPHVEWVCACCGGATLLAVEVRP